MWLEKCPKTAISSAGIAHFLNEMQATPPATEATPVIKFGRVNETSAPPPFPSSPKTAETIVNSPTHMEKNTTKTGAVGFFRSDSAVFLTSKTLSSFDAARISGRTRRLHQKGNGAPDRFRSLNAEFGESFSHLRLIESCSPIDDFAIAVQ